MKNKIDKLFKANASQGHFTYKDAYWADAEKLLGNTPKGGGISTGVLATAGILIIGASLIMSLISTTSTAEKDGKQKATDLSSESFYNEKETPTTINTPKRSKEKTSNYIELTKSIRTSTEDNDQTISNLGSSKAEATLTNKTITRNEIKHSVKGQERAVSVSTKKERRQKEAEISQKEALTSTATSLFTDVPKNTAEGELAKTETSTPIKDDAQPERENPVEQAKKTVPEIGAKELTTVNPQNIAQSSPSVQDESPELEKQIDPQPRAFKPLDNFTFALGADYSYLLASRFLSGDNADYINFRKSNESAQSWNSIGINAQVGYKNWLFNTGVYQTTLTENINYPSTLSVNVGIDNGTWNVNENWTYRTDSSWVIDSIYAGHWGIDTTWNVVYDSTYAEQWDSVKTVKEDPEIAKNNGSLSLSYVEVPVWFGRSFGAKRFTFDVQGGFAFGFLTSSNGSKYINANVSRLSEAGKEQFNKVLYSAMLRAGVRFKIASQWQVGVYPTLRYNLNSAVKLVGLKQNYLGYGIMIGLSYRF